MADDLRADKFSVILIARDEEDRLPRALSSVAFAGEIVVVVDSASTDRTETISPALQREI